MPVPGDTSRQSGNVAERHTAAQQQQTRQKAPGPPPLIPSTPPEGDARPDFEPGNASHVVATALAFLKGGDGATNIQKATKAPLSPLAMPEMSAEQMAYNRGATSEGMSEGQAEGIATKPPPPPDPVPDSNAAQSFGGDNLQSGSWTHDLLAALGLPVTFQNIRVLTAWQRAEGGGSNGASRSAFNWLNTTQNAPGAVDINDHHVKSYVSYNQGIMATAKTLSNGYYGAILSALAAGNDANRVARAVVASKWGSNDLIIRVLAGM